MKASMSSTWVFQLVIVFILIFAGYLTVTINYGKAFRLKNEVISIIEKNEGLTSGNRGAIALINNYLVGNAYATTGNCNAGDYGAKTLYGSNDKNSFEFVSTPSQGKYFYCVRKIKGYNPNNKAKSYYEIMLFSSFDLPILGDIFDFRATGRTAEIDVTYDDVFEIFY